MMNPRIPRLANPPGTAEVLREFVCGFRAAGYETISLDEPQEALDQLEANGWVLPKPPIETPGP